MIPNISEEDNKMIQELIIKLTTYEELEEFYAHGIVETFEKIDDVRKKLNNINKSWEEDSAEFVQVLQNTEVREMHEMEDK